MTTPPDSAPESMSYDPELHDPPPVLNVHKAALQEIDKVVGNELTLDEDDTTRLRGIIFAALSEEFPAVTAPRRVPTQPTSTEEAP